MRLIFFASKKTQLDYFILLSRHLECKSSVVWYKYIWIPSIRGLFKIPKDELKSIIKIKVKEKQNSSTNSKSQVYWLLYGIIKYLEAVYLFLKYFRYFKIHECEIIAVWNGNKLRQSIVVQVGKTLKKQLVYFENGLLPNTTTLDYRGVNAFNSLPRNSRFYKNLVFDHSIELSKNLVKRQPSKKLAQSIEKNPLPKRYIFVPFQVCTDSQITMHSPWIKDMRHLFNVVKYVQKRLTDRNLFFVFKEHPSCLQDYQDIIDKTQNSKALLFANNYDTQELIENAEAVITINSTVGLESLLYNKKVIVLGNAFYEIEGLVKKARSKDELLDLLQNLYSWQLDEKLRINFLKYIQSDYLLPGDWRNPTPEHWQSANNKLKCNLEKSSVAFFMVSTPLNLFTSVGIAALINSTTDCHLFFIDQVSNEKNIYIDSVSEWEESPFKSVHVLPSRVKGAVKKLKTRREAFGELKELISRLLPTEIYVGNDRRIEFQFAMHYLESLGFPGKGIYMDDGTFTYIGRKNKGLQDTIVDNAVKKVFYGRWWRQPPTVGASSWIDEAYVAFPEHVHNLIRSKKIHTLQADYFKSKEIKHLSAVLLKHFNLNIPDIESLDVIITLPHSSVIEETVDYANIMEELVAELNRADKKVGVKYHPRQTGSDELGFQRFPQVKLIPSRIAFEVLLPVLKQTIIIGDVSSTLLTTKWLRPDLKVLSANTNTNKDQAGFLDLFNKLGIEVVNDLKKIPKYFEHFNQSS